MQVTENNRALFSISFCVRWSSHPWTRRATPTCRGLWSRVKRPREESTPSTRPLFSNIHPPCPLLCVCAFQRLPCTGAPPRSWARATHAAASPHRLKNKKQKHPAPPPLAEPVHCMMTFGAALSLSSFSLSPLLSFCFCSKPLFGPGPQSPACRAGAWPLNPGLWCTSLSPPVGETVHLFFHFLSVGQSAVNQSVVLLPAPCFVLFFSSCLWVQPFGFVSLLLFFSRLPPSLAFVCISAPFVKLPPDSFKEICYQNTAKRCDSVLAVCWAPSGSWQWRGLLSENDNWREVQTF